jgi:predicted aspartyl protease
MGIFRTTILIENPAVRGVRREVPDVVVDTGSEYTWVPRTILESLELAPERVMRFQTADGRVIEREVAFANVFAGGTSAPDIVVFAEPDDLVLLGGRALEGLNLRVDVVTKQLVSAGPVPAALSQGSSLRSELVPSR